MKPVRAAVRLAAVGAWTLLAYAAWLASRVVVPFSTRAALGAHFAVTRAWARGLARISGMRLALTGRPPRAPFFLVCNHLSYVDIFLLLTQLDALFLAKSEIASWPLFGLLARSTGTLFIDRRKKSDVTRVLPLVERTLAAGYGVIVFPEGTSSAGDEVLSFKSGLFEVAARASLPVHCAALSYATPRGEISPRSCICWWGEMTFWNHLWRFLSLPCYEARLSFSPHPLVSPDRKDLARRAWEAVRAEFQPIRAPAAA